MLGPLVGHVCVLLYNTGTVGSPVWVPVIEIEDVNMPDLTMGMAELKRRSNNFTKNLPTVMQSFSINLNYKHGLGAIVFTQIQTDFFAGTCREWAILDGGITTPNVEGLRTPMLVEDFPWDQAHEQVSSHEIKLKIGYLHETVAGEVDPSWMTVST